jgi:UPF0716 protein FxsA
MSLVKWAFVVLLLLPAAEIGALLLVAAMLGWPLTVLLFLATTVLGAVLLQKSGRAEFDRLRQAVSADGLLGIHLETPGLAPMLGGILLVIPGFVTDLVGAAMFVPRCRQWASAALAKAARHSRDRSRDKSAPPIIDLDPAEWHQVDRSTNGKRKSGPARKPKRGV